MVVATVLIIKNEATNIVAYTSLPLKSSETHSKPAAARRLEGSDPNKIRSEVPRAAQASYIMPWKRTATKVQGWNNTLADRVSLGTTLSLHAPGTSNAGILDVGRHVYYCIYMSVFAVGIKGQEEAITLI